MSEGLLSQHSPNTRVDSCLIPNSQEPEPDWMSIDKEHIKMCYIHNGILYSHQKGNHEICKKTGATGNHCVKQNKPNCLAPLDVTTVFHLKVNDLGS